MVKYVMKKSRLNYMIKGEGRKIRVKRIKRVTPAFFKLLISERR